MRPCKEDYIIENFYPDNKELGKEHLKEEYGFLCYNASDYKFGLHDTAGGPGSETVNVVSIWNLRCSNTPQKGFNLPCPSDYDPTKPMKTSELQIWTKKVLYNPDDYKNPFESTWTGVAAFYLSYKIPVGVYLYLEEMISLDDTGFLVESIEKTSRFGVGKVETLNLLLDVSDRFYFNLFIGYDKIYKQYLRQYMKIQDLLALVGGILKAIITIFQLVNLPFNEHQVVDYIKNRLEKSKQFTPNINLKSEISNKYVIENLKKNDDCKSDLSKQELKNSNV